MREKPLQNRHVPSPEHPELPGLLPGDLVRAVQWIGAHLHEPVQIEKLAQVAGVSARTLQAHFTQYLGTTPLGWLRKSRLANVRRQLLDPGCTESITDVATANGFSQLGRFSVHYREAFGETPSQTRQRRVQPRPNPADVDDEAKFLTWRALNSAFQVAPEDCTDALENLARAQELAPNYGLPKAIEAWCLGQRAAHNFDSVDDGRSKSVRLAEEARALAPRDALTLSLCSGAMTLAHRLKEADALIERAIAMDPASAMAWVRRGWTSAYLGNSDAAIRELNYTLHLMPFEPVMHIAFIGIGCAHFDAGRYERAARWASEGVKAHPGSFWAERVVVAAAAHQGARDEARRTARSLLHKDPDLTADIARTAWPFTASFMERLAEGLEIAGVPRS
ncbi:MAG TPA: helix-turn-helix domain-containing protein [Pseudolabrys sp.]